MFSIRRQIDDLMNQMLSPAFTDPFFDVAMSDYPLLLTSGVGQQGNQQIQGGESSSGSSSALTPSSTFSQGQVQSFLSPQLIRSDVVEDQNQFKITCEVPGVPKENIKVNVENNHLTISGSKSEEKREEKEQQGQFIRRSERKYGDFRRSFRLPNNVDPNNLQAKYENGVLCIGLPKIEPKQPERREFAIQ